MEASSGEFGLVIGVILAGFDLKMGAGNFAFQIAHDRIVILQQALRIGIGMDAKNVGRFGRHAAGGPIALCEGGDGWQQ